MDASSNYRNRDTGTSYRRIFQAAELLDYEYDPQSITKTDFIPKKKDLTEDESTEDTGSNFYQKELRKICRSKNYPIFPAKKSSPIENFDQNVSKFQNCANSSQRRVMQGSYVNSLSERAAPLNQNINMSPLQNSLEKRGTLQDLPSLHKEKFPHLPPTFNRVMHRKDYENVDNSPKSMYKTEFEYKIPHGRNSMQYWATPFDEDQSTHNCVNYLELWKNLKDCEINGRDCRNEEDEDHLLKKNVCFHHCKKNIEEPYISPYTDPIIFPKTPLQDSEDLKSLVRHVPRVMETMLQCPFLTSKGDSICNDVDSSQEQGENCMGQKSKPLEARDMWLQKDIWMANPKARYVNFKQFEPEKNHLISSNKRIFQTSNPILTDHIIKNPKSESKESQEKCIETFQAEKSSSEEKGKPKIADLLKRKCYAKFENSEFGAIQNLPIIHPFTKEPLLHVSRTYQNINQGAELVGYNVNPKSVTKTDFIAMKNHDIPAPDSSNIEFLKVDCVCDQKCTPYTFYEKMR